MRACVYVCELATTCGKLILIWSSSHCNSRARSLRSALLKIINMAVWVCTRCVCVCVSAVEMCMGVLGVCRASIAVPVCVSVIDCVSLPLCATAIITYVCKYMCIGMATKQRLHRLQPRPPPRPSHTLYPLV